MEFLSSVEEFRERAGSVRGRKLVKEIRENVDRFEEAFTDDVNIESGWGHVYFCSKCGSFLHFDIASPHVHRCRFCGNEEIGPQYDASWMYLRRYDAIMSALQAAVLYKLNREERDLEYFKKVVGFYAENWYKFCEHGRHTWPSGNGKITPQALNEAIFLIKAAQGLELLKNDLPEEFMRNVKNWFLIPCAYFLDVQKRKIHNIPCWLNAAVGTAGLMCGNADLIDRAFTRQFGFADQVRGGGVTASYFWYEGSIHYNFFTLEAFMNTMLFAGIYGQEVPEDVRNTVYRMLLAPCRYAFANGRLPNPNDGWPNLNLKTYSFIYEMGAKIFAGTPEGREIASLADRINHLAIKRVAVPLSYPTYAGDVSLEWLLFGENSHEESVQPQLFTESCLFEASNFVILKTPGTEVFHKFGHNSPSHAHPDKMNIEVQYKGTQITHDLSNCGYAARLCPEFHRTSVSHNTVVRNGENHPTTQMGKLVSYSETSAETLSVEAYPNTDFRRAITVQENGFTDTFSVEQKTGEKAVFDWVFHVDGVLTEEPAAEAAELKVTENGYSFIHDVKKVAGSDVTLHWAFADGVTGVQHLSLEGKELFIGKSPDNPPDKERERTTLIMRSAEHSPVFTQEWSFAKEAADVSLT